MSRPNACSIPPKPTREFLHAITWVTALCTAVGLAGITLSILLWSTDGPPFADPLTRQRLYISFDGFMWGWIAGPMFIPHVRVKYRALYNHWQMRAASALGLLSVLVGHGTWLIYPEWDRFEVITNFIAFLLINVMPLIVGKWLVVRESKKPPSPTSPGTHAFPNQHKHSTLMFPGIIIALTSYGVSLPMENATIQAMCLLLVLGTGAVVCIVALKYRFQLKGHFDYLLMLWCAYHVAPVARRAILAVEKLGVAHPIVLIYGYRGLLSMFVIMFDDIMEATFGAWPQSLWGTYFMRLIESLVSFTMALNGINETSAVLTYVGTNVFITTLKDSGLQDDVRYLMMNGYFIWAPVKRYFPGSTHHPRPALESIRSLPPIVATSADAAGADSTDSHSASSAASPTGPIATCAANPTVPSLISWWFPPKVIKHTTQDQVKALSVDLGIQIERSELTLMSRVSSFACVAACYCLTQLWQRTSTSRLLLHQKESAKFAAAVLLVLSLAELVVSRAIAVVIMNRKIRRLHKLMRVTGVTAEDLHMHQQCGTSAHGGGTAGTKVNSATALARPIRSAAMHQSASMASGLAAENVSLASMQRILPPSPGGAESAGQHRGEGTPPPVAHAMWSTRLPRNRSFRQLVFALIVFTTLVHFGAW